MEGLIKHYVSLNKEPDFLPSYYYQPKGYETMYFARVLAGRRYSLPPRRILER